MKKTENPSITATRLLLKKRRKALSLCQINKVLADGKLKPVTAADMDKNFKHVCDGANGQKWLLGGTPANAKKTSAKVCNKKVCGKKIIKEKAAKSSCKNDEPDEVAGYCKIVTSENFDAAAYNQRVAMHNALVLAPAALEHPDAFVFLAGAGSWPEVYRDVEVLSNPNFSGVILCPRKFLKEVHA